MRRFLAIGVAIVLGSGSGAAAAAAAAVSGAHHTAPAVVRVHKTCPSGYTHAVIGGEQKCLHAGEYCARSEASQYRRYHFVCEDVRGTYRLEQN